MQNSNTKEGKIKVMNVKLDNDNMNINNNNYLKTNVY